MSAAWRQVGLNYINYSKICALAVRQCLKSDIRETIEDRNHTIVKMSKWAEGKAGKSTSTGPEIPEKV